VDVSSQTPIEAHVAKTKIDGIRLIPIVKIPTGHDTGRPKHRPTPVFAQRVTLWTRRGRIRTAFAPLTGL
jgi:hypothetical protein